VKTWQRGMRVEALDRKTPTLICVATVGMNAMTLLGFIVFACCVTKRDFIFVYSLFYCKLRT